ncbi:major facilitator superfamily domain-containing protein [Zychaea mexicana]|uniref:major facilitator superfamily domain-containing protein n=1 Tax=Zychaea mexicana TaxID=64656 RepID=UPI0022FEE741|nr:major facilitator superfamily domain-containing protein [Zychaea mexicana]KAI9489626.1 major facilitator superfamily domain-containing protein [Zychaea mexicana]
MSTLLKDNKELSSTITESKAIYTYSYHVEDKSDDARSDCMSQSTYAKGGNESEEKCLSADDGGYGWLVVFGAFMGVFTIYGVTNICFVGGVFTPISNLLESVLGARRTLLIATILISGGCLAAGSATEVWQLYLALSICFGMGFSIMIMVTSKTVPLWFNRRKGTAMGIVASSGGLGGLILPFGITSLNSSLGASWYGTKGNIEFVKEKTLPTKRAIINPCDVLRLSLLRDTNFIIWSLAASLQVSYMNMLFYFLPSYATHIGLDTMKGSALISVTSATTFVGRLFVGALADYAGNLNMCILFNVVTSLASFFIWTFAYNFVGLLMFAITYGFFGGCYLALVAPIVRTVLGPERFASGFALMSFIVAPAYAGPSIASALENVIPIEPFLVFKLYTGITAFASAVAVLILKLRIKRQLWAKI